MDTNQPISDYKKFLAIWKNFYFAEWQGNEKPSPAFDREVVKITRAGWNHIVGNKVRSISEIRQRLLLLPQAKKLLEISTTYQLHKTSDDGEVHYWEVRGIIEHKHVQVVVRQIEGSYKHLFSIFDYSKRPMNLSLLKSWSQ